ACPIPILVSDCDNRIVAANPEAERLFDQPDGSLTERDWRSVYDEAFEPLTFDRFGTAPLDAADPAAPLRYRGTVGPAAGAEVEARTRRVPDANGFGGLIHTVVQTSDARCGRADREEFLFNVAHELQTPMATLSMSIEYLLDDLPRMTPAERQRKLAS